MKACAKPVSLELFPRFHVSHAVRRLLCFLLLLFSPARAEQCLVLGDSLTKEYEATFVGLYPNNPAAWQARNWIEILHQHRTDWFDTGTWSVYSAPRLTGHRFNWAFPGATTSEIRTLLTNFINKATWVPTLENHIRNDVQRVVIFAGGNDADSYYANLYNGAATSAVTNTTLQNIQWLTSWVRNLNATVPIVIVSVPHVGCTPKVQQGYPTHPVYTARVTAAMDTLNANLAAWVGTYNNLAFVPGVYEFTKNIITQPYRIRGIEFYRVPDADARARYVFSGDGFHPSTCAHAKIAQMVIEAFNSKFPTAITPLSDDYLITGVLGLDPNIPFNEWMAAQGQSGGFTGDSDLDGVPNLLEFALEGVTGAASLPQPVFQNGSLTLNFRPRAIFSEWGVLTAESSPDLQTWQTVPQAQIVTNPDGSRTVSLSGPGSAFLRLKAAK